ncbi:hypothetical protein DACRYDRAFT_117857 [Dacryopinax primogenitus]|uniref:t-SNARE coiled-coil homology domain-containing protein n=1 Tax=Dacryopinax primogenitus (strain DJM 731) TaxID=1858805 RepID=M5FRC5_DACPD|nr:uncharacterized protein DACRYDRAFT_117857 [Dacryopinax primogenitus]EJT99665.1 hypothetical protein DACRYDRAFT_117857 [Dacryopinax primogenitus]
MPPHPPATPARLNIFVSRTLPLILDRNRLVSAFPPQPVPPSLASQINTNVASIVNGIVELEGQSDPPDTADLRASWDRMRIMLGSAWDGIDLPAQRSAKAEQLVHEESRPNERDTAIPFRDSLPPSPTFSPHTELQMQSQLMENQDEHLDHLSNSIRRQHELGLQIGSELDVHTGLLEELDHDVDRTDSSLTRARRRLEAVARGARNNASAWSIGLLIFVLLILIIVFKT